MRSPKDMRIIQIDITNACVHQCSNCTRFCGHHKKPYFMDYDTFKKAVDSFEGFQGCIGVMGGEPTIHPEFERFVKYIGDKYRSTYNIQSTRKPIVSFAEYIHDKNYILDEMLNKRKGPGLWSSVCESYYRHFEIIQDTFSFQNINDHNNKSLHQPMLVSRKEMGIDDEEWISIRENCLVQNQWSATITPKGAFFCEVAAALDMLFEGPGGWKIEQGWWKREPEDFGAQLNWCEICGGAILNSGRLSNEEIDDVSPMLYKMLERVESPKLKKGRVLVMDMQKQEELQPMPNTINRYLTQHEERLSKNNRTLYPRSIREVYIQATKKFGKIMNKEINKPGSDWIAYSESEYIPDKLIERLENVVLNPGVIYIIGSFYIFSVKASALRGNFAEISVTNNINQIVDLWQADKIIKIDDTFDQKVNPDLKDWYAYVDDLDREDKSEIYRCLDKIKSDYE